ncbi:MAG: signal peptidase I [Bacilli bacterium]|nr:signal peptidase I [Bacilli bacterium]
MKTSEKQILIIELVMILFLTLNFFISNVFSPYIYVAFLAIIFGVSFFLLGLNRNGNVNRKRVFTSVSIVVLAYFLVTYLVGLMVGFTRTIYNSFSITNLTKNILPVVLIIGFSELTRFIFIDKSNKNKYLTILSFVVFFLFTASYNYKLYDFSVYNDIFQYIGIIILGNISTNIFLTIQCKNTGFVNNIIYRLVMEVYVFIVPFTPTLGPYVTAVLAILIPVICAFVVYNTVKKDKLDKPPKSRRKNIIAAMLVFIVIIVVMSNSGFFKYQNMTIGSNSMKPYMSKGDVIILEKLDKKEMRDLKKGDILVFRYNTKIIAHRIYEVIDNGSEIMFRTKGDANDQIDNTLIREPDVIGVLRYRIRYIGLPSIWIQELFK